ncbi:hypothetical protein V2K52_14010 [Pseudomonas alliivorans]|nr:hypothetical protein [Pseudomonas alliivorans]MEE4791210.1 hypothetical protein [Pseudomonas alliivorans]MEE4797361.1 hypothetical protein [Pseudomonas alliivorans]MEE4807810.1 hypothetical protein [Pseudomonas alliivorans]MEE4822664.1 hypothetical protein [Pseudomonas alliivorans]
MPYTKMLLCLACSQKPGGFCVAGKEFVAGRGAVGWVRPVNTGAHSAITLDQRKYPSTYYAVKLDLIRIEFEGEDSTCFQAENHFVTAKQWTLEKKFKPDMLQQVVDSPDGLWQTGCDSTRHGLNDRVHERKLAYPTTSLYLIKVGRINTIVETACDTGKKKLRGEFEYCGVTYRLWIKDIQWQKKYASFDDGEYPEDVNFLTISLGVIHTDGYAYKLIAAVY